MVEPLECDGPDLYELGRELLNSGVSFWLEVRGWSMYPFLKDKDVVEISPIQFDEVGIGDVVFFRSGDRLLAHRVVGAVSDEQGIRLRVRGDRFRQEDPLLAESDLIGKVEVIHRERRLGRRVIRLDQGLAKSLGRLVAQSRFVHRCVRWGAGGVLRVGNPARRFPAVEGDGPE